MSESVCFETINLIALENYYQGVYRRKGALALRRAAVDMLFHMAIEPYDTETSQAIETLLEKIVTKDIADEARFEEGMIGSKKRLEPSDEALAHFQIKRDRLW